MACIRLRANDYPGREDCSTLHMWLKECHSAQHRSPTSLLSNNPWGLQDLQDLGLEDEVEDQQDEATEARMADLFGESDED